MKNKMTDEAIRTVINNAPEGAEYWTSGYDVGYRKLVLDCVFGWIPDDAKWVRAIDNDIAMERVDKGFWIPNLVKELVERQSKPIPQTKEVEWDGEGLPPVGCLIKTKEGEARVLSTSTEEGGVVTYSWDDGLNIGCSWNNKSWINPLETKEDLEKREREENGKSLYELVQNLWCSVDSKYTAHP